MTKYFMCIYLEHMCTLISNIKFRSLILWLGGLCTDDIDTNGTNADDNYARRKNYDYIGPFGMIQDEPKSIFSGAI